VERILVRTGGGEVRSGIPLYRMAVVGILVISQGDRGLSTTIKTMSTA
jgi:hypothetical protein